MANRTLYPSVFAAAVLVTFSLTSAKADYHQEVSGRVVDVATNMRSPDSADDRLLIVNGQTGHVIYDDGRDDLFCVTRKVVVCYNEFGYPIRKRVMRCR